MLNEHDIERSFIENFTSIKPDDEKLNQFRDILNQYRKQISLLLLIYTGMDQRIQPPKFCLKLFNTLR